MKDITPANKINPWIRGLYMLLYSIIYGLVEMGIFLIAAFQFGHNVLLGNPQSKLIELGKKLSDYNYHIYMYLTFNTEQHPYPFDDE